MQLVHPPLTLVAVTISTLLAGSVQAAAPESQDTATADETLTVLGQTLPGARQQALRDQRVEARDSDCDVEAGAIEVFVVRARHG